jgi:hypothetical protein
MRRLALSLLLCLAVGCSAPPIKERKQADAAIAAAKAANAETYAPDDLKSAEQSLSRYDGAVAQRDFQQALNLALAARDEAYDATKKAGDRRTALKTQFDQLVLETQGLVGQANARLAPSKATAVPASRSATTRLRQAIRTTTTAMQEASARAAEGDLIAAVKRLSAAPDEMRREIAAFDGPGRKGRGARSSGKIAASATPPAQTVRTN